MRANPPSFIFRGSLGSVVASWPDEITRTPLRNERKRAHEWVRKRESSPWFQRRQHQNDGWISNAITTHIRALMWPGYACGVCVCCGGVPDAQSELPR